MAQQDSVEFEKVQVEPAYRVVANSIEREIMEGRIKPGQKLPSELALAAQLGVNRSTIREGIRLLEQNGLVSREGGRRLIATVPRKTVLADRISRAMVLQEVTFLELWETMLALEVAAAQSAARRASDEIIDRIEENLRQTEAAINDSDRLAQLDIEFHLLVAQACENRALMLAREPISLLFYPSFINVMSRLNAGERLLAAHREVARGIRAHDPRHTAEWMEKHIKDFMRGYELANLDINQAVEAYTPQRS